VDSLLQHSNVLASVIGHTAVYRGHVAVNYHYIGIGDSADILCISFNLCVKYIDDLVIVKCYYILINFSSRAR